MSVCNRFRGGMRLARQEERMPNRCERLPSFDREFSQVAMKRSQPSTTPSTPSSPVHKKIRMSPNPFEVLADDTESGWTRVEKRKAKKVKKVEAKIDVCVYRIYFSSCCRKLTDSHPWWSRPSRLDSCITVLRSSSVPMPLASMYGPCPSHLPFTRP